MKKWATPFLAIVTALISAACGAPEPTQAPTPTAMPSRTLAPTEIIDTARVKMGALSTVHISIDVPPYETETEVRTNGGVFRSRERSPGFKSQFDVRFPYEVRGVTRGSGEPKEVGVLLTRGKAFTGDPKGSCWSEQSHALGAVFLSSPAVQAVLLARLDVAEALRNLEQVPDETPEGKAFYHLSFDIDAPSWHLNVLIPALAQAIGEQFVNEMYPPETREQAFSAPTGFVFKGAAWIHKETLLLHRFLWKQLSTRTGEPGFTSTVTVSRFDQGVPKAPDLEAIARLVPCP